MNRCAPRPPDSRYSSVRLCECTSSAIVECSRGLSPVAGSSATSARTVPGLEASKFRSVKPGHSSTEPTPRRVVDSAIGLSNNVGCQPSPGIAIHWCAGCLCVNAHPMTKLASRCVSLVSVSLGYRSDLTDRRPPDSEIYELCATAAALDIGQAEGQ